MASLPAKTSLINTSEDQAILYPCFRFEDVKRALRHIARKIGLTRIRRPDIPYMFFYSLNDILLAVMITPTRFDDDRMCYGFQSAYLNAIPDRSYREVKSSPLTTQWHLYPSNMYLELLQSLELKDVRHLVESFTAKGLLPQQSSYLEPLDLQVSTVVEYSWKDLDLLHAMEINGFPTPSYTEFTSLLFWKVHPSFLHSLGSHGYNYFSVEEIGILWRDKIPASYLQALANAGYGRFSADEYRTLYNAQVAPFSVQMLSDQGYTMLSSTEISRMARYGSCRLLPVQAGVSRGLN